MIHSERNKRPEPYPADVKRQQNIKKNIAKCTSFLPFETFF